MSSSAIARIAAYRAVAAPMAATIVPAWVANAYNAFSRTSRYTPAVTIVAAWMSADTGVGPSIASGSQT